MSEALRWLKARGALAVGVTAAEDRERPLLDHADAVFRPNCGPEQAACATKAFNAQLFAAAALAGYPLTHAAEQAAQAMDAALKTQENLGLSAMAYSKAEFLHGPVAMCHRSDRVVLFSDADEPMDSKQAVVTLLLARGVPFSTIGTDTTREAALLLQLPEERWARTPVLAVLSQLTCAELAPRQQGTHTQ